MMRPSRFTIVIIVIAIGVALASVDLFRLEKQTLVLYATPPYGTSSRVSSSRTSGPTLASTSRSCM